MFGMQTIANYRFTESKANGFLAFPELGFIFRCWNHFEMEALNPMRKLLLLLSSTAPLLLTGCGTVRNIEQWKCDHLGMCHFGITPSLPASAPWDSSIYPPMYGQAGEAMIASPPLSEMYTHPGAHGSGSHNCPHCPK
jgi:hypothetical protein